MSANEDPLFKLTGLPNKQLADTLHSNPRAYMALKGAVAEKHLELHLGKLVEQEEILSFRKGTGDFEKDFYLVVSRSKKEIIVECKNVQVISTATLTSRKQYLAFLRNAGFLSQQEFKALLPMGHENFEEASTLQLKAAFTALPLDLRESGLARYAFSKEVCAVDSIGRLTESNCQRYLQAFNEYPITIDFQRTRNSRDAEDEDNKANRFYKVGEVDIVAACLFSRTLTWDFIFCAANKFERHPKYRNRYSNALKIDAEVWKADLGEALDDHRSLAA